MQPCGSNDRPFCHGDLNRVAVPRESAANSHPVQSRSPTSPGARNFAICHLLSSILCTRRLPLPRPEYGRDRSRIGFSADGSEPKTASFDTPRQISYASVMGKCNPIPQALEEKLKAIDVEVRNLYFKWQFFSQLFTDAQRVAILNATASSLFQSIEDSMLSDILLAIARLTDPKKSVGKENLSFDNLLQEIPQGSLRMQIVDLLAKIKQKTREMRAEFHANGLAKLALFPSLCQYLAHFILKNRRVFVSKRANLILRRSGPTQTEPLNATLDAV